MDATGVSAIAYSVLGIAIVAIITMIVIWIRREAAQREKIKALEQAVDKANSAKKSAEDMVQLQNEELKRRETTPDNPPSTDAFNQLFLSPDDRDNEASRSGTT